MRAQDQVGLERQDVAAHALDIVFERIGLGSGVDDLDSAPALGMLVEQILQQLRPWALAVAQSGPEGLRLPESEDTEGVALVALDVRTAKAEIVDPDRGVEHASGGTRNKDERQLL
jgi:hypothetical protein